MFYLKDHLEKLPSFNAVARTQSISHAATQLHMSQAALSHSIKVLEEALGVPLFTRKPKGVELTEAGQILYDFSKNLIPQLETIESKVRKPGDQLQGFLKVGTHETLAIHLLPSVLERFLVKYPGMNVSVTSGRIDGLIQGLKNKDFHLVFTVEPIGHPELIIDVIFENRLAFFAAPKKYPHRFECLKKEKISLQEASSVPVLTDTQAHQEQYLPIPRMLIQAGILAEQRFELNSFEAAIQLAAKGLGMALLPERNANSAVKQGLLREITVAGLPKNFGYYRLCATRLKDCPMELSSLALLEELRMISKK